MKTFVLGDIHARSTALKQVLKKCKFDYEKDRLIFLGDVVDGGKDTKGCVDELLKIKNLIFIRGNHDCVDKETECLTQEGWKKYDKINQNDKIYSYDIKNKKGVWSDINKIIIKRYRGKMIYLKTKHGDMLMTPNHRFFHKAKAKREPTWNKWNFKMWKYYNYVLAKDLIGSYDIFSAASENLKEYFISDDMIRVCAWILTDGGIDKNGYIIIYQSKENYVKEIRDLLNRLNFNYREINFDTKVRKIKNRILKKKPKRSYEFIIRAVSCKKIPLKEKYKLPNWAFYLSDRQSKIFLDTLIKGDGSANWKNAKILYGKKEFLDDVQRFCAIKNFRAFIGYCETGNYYRLNIMNKNTWGFNMSDVYEDKKRFGQIDYNDIVWCLNVPYSNFMVRRNNRCYFTGNCWFMNWIDNGQVEDIWYHQGGIWTMRSYGNDIAKIPANHQDLFNKSIPYYIENDILFVHGGYDPYRKFEEQKDDLEILYWDRSLVEYARQIDITEFKHVFVGHTTTQNYDSIKPITLGNLTMLDTGAGWSGYLTIMDLETRKYWQSDKQTPARTKEDEIFIKKEMQENLRRVMQHG